MRISDWSSDVCSSDLAHSVREFVETAFAEVGKTIRWEGSGVEEKGRDAESGAVLVEIDPRYFRPTEVDLLLGNPTKARDMLGWSATTQFKELVAEMIKSDLESVQIGRASCRERVCQYV